MMITILLLYILCSNPLQYVLFIFNSHKTTMSRLISFVFYFLLYIFLHPGLSMKERGGARGEREAWGNRPGEAGGEGVKERGGR